MDIHAAVYLADGHVAVDAVGFEFDFARQLEHYALAAFVPRTQCREEAAPVILDTDAKLARIMLDFDLAELQVLAFPGRADDQDLGVIRIGGLDIYTPVDAGNNDVRARLE